MVHCGPHEGRHTSELVADRIDAVIESLGFEGVLEAHKAMTTDNAANMVAACRESHHIDSAMGCFDHHLNLIVKNGMKKVPEIIRAVMSFKRLATATHKSVLYCERIKRECNDLEKSVTKYSGNVKYVKIIQPIDTRWNSTLMCIRSIINLETPLMEIMKIKGRAVTKDKIVENLQMLIPKKSEFAELRLLIPLLSHFEKVSQIMSAEKVPTLPWLSYRVAVLKNKCNIHEPKNAAMYPPAHKNLRKLAALYYGDLNARFKSNCTLMYEPAVCCILNPALKGFLVKDAGQFEKTVKEMIRREEGEPEAPSAMNEAMVVTHDENDDDFLISQMTQHLEPTPAGTADSQMNIELNLYMSTAKSLASCDILEFWRVNEKQFPSLAKVVKKYFCIQASSSSSERTFSASGNIVTPRRNKLDPENVNLLVYLKENLGKIKIPKIPPKEDKEDKEDQEDKEEDGVLLP